MVWRAALRGDRGRGSFVEIVGWKKQTTKWFRLWSVTMSNWPQLDPTRKMCFISYCIVIYIGWSISTTAFVPSKRDLSTLEGNRNPKPISTFQFSGAQGFLCLTITGLLFPSFSLLNDEQTVAPKWGWAPSRYYLVASRHTLIIV